MAEKDTPAINFDLTPRPPDPQALTEQQVNKLVDTIASRYDDSEQAHALVILAHEIERAWRADQFVLDHLVIQITNRAAPWTNAGKQMLDDLPDILRATLETPSKGDVSEPDEDDSGEGGPTPPPPQAASKRSTAVSDAQEGEQEYESTHASGEQIEGWAKTLCEEDSNGEERTKAFLLLFSEIELAVKHPGRIDSIQISARQGALKSGSELMWYAGRELADRLRVQAGLPPVDPDRALDLPHLSKPA